MIEDLKRSFKSIYGKDSEFVVKAPGRVNLIGEHTDYNGGYILPAAIDRVMCFTFSKNPRSIGRVHAKDLNQNVIIDLADLKKTQFVWANYIIGLLIEFKSKGFELIGFDCVFTSDIPIGAGVSSSAALECGFVMGMDHLIRSNLSKWAMVDMSHHSNHSFMNIYGGIMDQFSSLFGRKNQCMLMDCSDRTFQYHDFNLEGYAIVLINSKVQHEHTTSGYNERAAECKEIVESLSIVDSSINKISDANIDLIEKLGVQWPDHLRKRAIFVLNENARVKQFTDAMHNKDFIKCGQLLYESHDGLQKQFEVSCSELDLLVDLTKSNPDVLGARMMGGGFGGCTINLIKSDSIVEVSESIVTNYYHALGIYPEVYEVSIAKGAEIIL